MATCSPMQVLYVPLPFLPFCSTTETISKKIFIVHESNETGPSILSRQIQTSPKHAQDEKENARIHFLQTSPSLPLRPSPTGRHLQLPQQIPDSPTSLLLTPPYPPSPADTTPPGTWKIPSHLHKPPQRPDSNKQSTPISAKPTPSHPQRDSTIKGNPPRQQTPRPYTSP